MAPIASRPRFSCTNFRVISPAEQTWIHWFFLSTRKEVSSTCITGAVSSRSIAAVSQRSSAQMQLQHVFEDRGLGDRQADQGVDRLLHALEREHLGDQEIE